MYVHVWYLSLCLCIHVHMCASVSLCHMYVCMHVYLCVCVVHLGDEGMEKGSVGDRNIKTAAFPVRGLFFSFLFLGVV